MYEGKLKVLDLAYVKLGRNDRWIGTRTKLVSPPYYENDKDLLIAVHGSMGTSESIRAR